jgi:rhodanese-related sulfurtransferase
MHGAWGWYRTDGSLMRSGEFDRGKQVGVRRTFDRAGRLVKETDFGATQGRATPKAVDGHLRDDSVMDQPHQNAALGREPIRTIGREELKEKLDRGDDLKLIMALNRWAYDAKHIPGSIHFDSPDELLAAVHPDDEVVVYCSNVDCLSSVALYRDLVRRGYQNVRRYSGGLLDWEAAGLPLEGSFVTVP